MEFIEVEMMVLGREVFLSREEMTTRDVVVAERQPWEKLTVESSRSAACALARSLTLKQGGKYSGKYTHTQATEGTTTTTRKHDRD